MKPLDVQLGDLVKTSVGLVTVMKFLAPKFVACIIVHPRYPQRERYRQGEWIYLRGLDFDEAEIITEETNGQI